MRQLCCYAFFLALLAGVGVPVQANGDKFDFDLGAEGSSPSVGDVWTFLPGGFLESREQYALHKGEFHSARQKAFVELKGERKEIGFYVSVEAEFDPAAHRWRGKDGRAWRAIPREAYLTCSTEYFDLFAGQKIVTWGAGDGVNLLDLFNPDDMRDPAADVRTRAKRPIPMLQTVWKVFSPLVLEGILLPWGQVSRRWPRKSPWAPSFLETMRDRSDEQTLHLHEDDAVSGAEGGVRLFTTVGSWDLAFIYFNGFQNQALYDLISDGSGLVEVRERHPRLEAWGMTFAAGIGNGTLRGEVAWKPDYGMTSAAGEFFRADLVEAVLGIDYTFGTNFYWNIQWFMGAMTERRSRVDYPVKHGITLNIADKFLDDALEVGIKAALYLEGEDGGTLQAYAAYDLWDNWKATLAYTCWDGPSAHGAYGQYRGNDMLSLTVRCSF